VGLVDGMVCYELTGAQSMQILARAITPTKKWLTSPSGGIWKELLRSCRQHVLPPSGAVLGLEIQIPPVLGPFPPGRRLRDLPVDNDPPNVVTPPWLLQWPKEVAQSRLWDADARERSRLSKPKRFTTRSRKRKTNIKALLERIEAKQAALASLLEEPSAPSQPTAAAAPSRPPKPPAGPQASARPSGVTEDHPMAEGTDKGTVSAGVPALLVCRSKDDGGGFGGYDLILPTGCGAPRLWTLMARAKARPIGHRDRHKLHDIGVADFPWDFPETEAGKLLEAELARESMVRWGRRPASKRVNYPLIGIPYPFCPHWTNACTNAMQQQQPQQQQPQQSKGAVAERQKDEKRGGFSAIRTLSEILAFSKVTRKRLANDAATPPSDADLLEWGSVLLPVKVMVHRRGIADRLSHLFHMTPDDVRAFIKGERIDESSPLCPPAVASHLSSWIDLPKPSRPPRRPPPSPAPLGHPIGSSVPRVPRHEPPTFLEGMHPAFRHRKSKMRDKLKRREEAKKGGAGDNEADVSGEGEEDVCGGFESSVPCRSVIGFVTTGGQSLKLGIGCGTGCVSAAFFLRAASEQMQVIHQELGGRKSPRAELRSICVLVWLRQTSSRYYRPAWVTPSANVMPF